MSVEKIIKALQDKFGVEVENPYPRRLRVKIPQEGKSEEERREMLRDMLSYAKELGFQHVALLLMI